MSLRQESLYPWSGLRFITSIVVSTAFVWSTYVVVGGVWGRHAPTETHTSAEPQRAPMAAQTIADPWAPKDSPPKDSPRALPFQASATRHFRPDTMTFTITASAKGGTNTASARAVHATVRKVHDLMLAQGITEDEILYGVAQTDQTGGTSDDGGSNAPPVYDSTQEITVTVTNIERGQRAWNAAVISDSLGTVDVAAATCSAHATDEIQEALISEAREKVAAEARLAMKQYGGELGQLETADTAGTAEIGSDCSDIVATVTASATYQLK
jgi:hypothetical protein